MTNGAVPQNVSSPVGLDNDGSTHHETPRDPLAPAEALPTETSQPCIDSLMFGPFRSVQVNVDRRGRNIVGDAANEPSIALDPTDPNKIVIGWRQFDSVQSDFRQAGWAYSHDGGQTWTFPGVLEPGVFRSDPVLDSDADGNFYYYSIRCPQAGCGDLFKSTDGGVSWLGPVYAYGGDKPWMAIDRTDGKGRGHIYCIWGGFARSTDGGLTFTHHGAVSVRWSTLTVGPDGTLYVVDFPERGYVSVFASRNAQKPNRTPVWEMLTRAKIDGVGIAGGPPNGIGLLGQPWIAVDHSNGPSGGNLYVLASVDGEFLRYPLYDDRLDVMFTRSTDGGETWSTPVRVNDDRLGENHWQWFGTMAVAPSGRIDAIWNDTRASEVPNLSELYYAFSIDGGDTWSLNTPISPVFDSHVGRPQQPKLGDYYDMISNELGAYVAYAATFNGEQDIYFQRVLLDCNGNGVHDGDDILAGVSEDRNGNLVPDECDTIDCDAITEVKATCVDNEARVKVRSTLPPGTRLGAYLGGERAKLRIHNNGRGKITREALKGDRVFLADCPKKSGVATCVCDGETKLYAKCKNRGSKLTATVGLGAGRASVTFRIDGDPRSDVEAVLNSHGCVEIVVKGLAPGRHTVELLECGLSAKARCR